MSINKKHIKNLIGKGETELALEMLLNFLPEADKIYNKLTLLKGQWVTAQEQVKLGLESNKAMGVVFNRITNATLSLIENVPESKLSEISETPNTRATLQKICNNNADEFTYDIFLSFSSIDIDYAREICNQLRGYGLRVFFSADDMRLKGGYHFSEVIDNALENSCHFLLYCTPNAMNSEWVKIEFTAFHDQIYLPNRNSRRFLIMEGFRFDLSILRIIYRSIQRVKQTEDIFNILISDSSKNEITNSNNKEIKHQVGGNLKTLQKSKETYTLDNENIIQKKETPYKEKDNSLNKELIKKNEQNVSSSHTQHLNNRRFASEIKETLKSSRSQAFNRGNKFIGLEHLLLYLTE